MKLLCIVVTPPPVNGMTIVSKFMLDNFKQYYPIKIFTIHKNNNFLWKLKRFFFAIFSFPYIILNRAFGYNLVYIVCESRKTIYTRFLIYLCVLMRMKILMHHHVYRYINTYDKNIAKISNYKSLTHIFLSEQMRDNFRSVYQIKNSFIVNNAVLFSKKNSECRKSKEIKHIGYLSNLTIEKGGIIFLDIAQRLLDSNPDIFISIAGPIDDESIGKRLGIMNNLYTKRFKYVGAVYGQDKFKFLADLDLLLFPTQYKNEAQPLVLYEAMSCNTNVISLNRGVISEQINDIGMCLGINATSDEFSDAVLKFNVKDYSDPANILINMAEKEVISLKENLINIRNGKYG
jgi:glycosyltransferase involved in cell wall biosynthesis